MADRSAADDIEQATRDKLVEQASEEVLAAVRAHPNYPALIDHVAGLVLGSAGLA